MSDDIITTLENACIASCNCDTKTPDSEYHAPLCRYRALDEAIRHITDQRVTIANQAQMYASDSLRLLAKGMHIREVEAQLASYRASAEAEIAQLREQLSASQQSVTAANYGPTLAAEINALPDRLRRYVHDLETRADPTWDVRRAFLAEENAVALNNLAEELQQELAALTSLLAECSRRIRDTPAPTSLVSRIERALAQHVCGARGFADSGDVCPACIPVPVAVDHEGKPVHALCDDCPPPRYPSNKTRCASCPRRTDSINGGSNV